MNTRRMTLLIAIVLALGTGYLTISYLGSLRSQAPQQADLRPIIVAGIDIPARAKITPDMLRSSQRAATEVDPDAVLDPKQAVGSLALISIPAGSVITHSKIGRPADVGLTVRLPRGMRAVSIGIDHVKGVSGLVEPGDLVDVIAIPPRTNAHPKAYTILRAAIVMALGNQLETAGATPAPGMQDLTTVTLAVTPSQADLLAMADVNTVLRLALRSPQEPVHSLAPEQLTFDVPGPSDGGGNSAPRENPPPIPYPMAPAAPPPAATVIVRPPSSGVEVIDGDRIVSGADSGPSTLAARQ
jgi:pilus assembly protein CpaB